MRGVHIGLVGYGQKDPLIEYKKESFTLFQDLMDRIEDESIRFLFFLQRDEGASGREVPNVPHPELWEDEEEEEEEPVEDFTRNIQRKKEKELAALQFVGGEASAPQQPVLAKDKVGRNDPCPCGSGKKYKKCCGA